MNQPWVYVSPHPEHPSHMPPHSIPLGCPRAPALSALLHALNLDCSSILHMVIYKFQSYSFKSSHPHLLPQNPKVCSLHLCLLCCLAQRVIITVFLSPFSSVQFSSVAQSCPTLRLHESQHARPPCPSPTPGVYSSPCP